MYTGVSCGVFCGKEDEVILVLRFTPGPVSRSVPVCIVVEVGHFVMGYF